MEEEALALIENWENNSSPLVYSLIQIPINLFNKKLFPVVFGIMQAIPISPSYYEITFKIKININIIFLTSAASKLNSNS